MSYVDNVIEQVKIKNAHEPEFIQAVTEVLTSLAPVIESNPAYEKAGLLERIVEPERVPHSRGQRRHEVVFVTRKIERMCNRIGGMHDSSSQIAAEREQWNDGSNTLCIAPGVVVVYDRNYVTNQILEDSGIRVLKMPSAELSRGRGGPRCMSMPLWRDEI